MTKKSVGPLLDYEKIKDFLHHLLSYSPANIFFYEKNIFNGSPISLSDNKWVLCLQCVVLLVKVFKAWLNDDVVLWSCLNGLSTCSFHV